MNKYKQAVAVSIAIAALAGCGEDFSDFDYAGDYYITYGDDCEKTIPEGVDIPDFARAKIGSRLMRVYTTKEIHERGGMEHRPLDYLDYYGVMHRNTADYFNILDDGSAEIAFTRNGDYDHNNKGKVNSINIMAKPIDREHIIITSMVEYKPSSGNKPFDLLKGVGDEYWTKHIRGKTGICLERRSGKQTSKTE